MFMFTDRASKRLVGIFSMLIISASAYISLNNPFYDTDMLFYTGIYYEHKNNDPEELHRLVYSEIWQPLDSNSRVFLSEKPLEIKAKQSPDYFIQQLPFYKIKPGYNFLIRLLTDYLEVKPTLAIQYINITAYVLTALIIFMWLYPFMPAVYLFICTSCICTLPLFIFTSRMFTPDMPSVLLIMLGSLCYCMPKQNLSLAFSAFLLALLFRPDNLLLIILLGASHFYFQRHNLKTIITFNIIALAIYICIGYFYKAYGWKITFQHSAIDLSVAPKDWEMIPLHPYDYILALLRGVFTYKMSLMFTGFASVVLYRIAVIDAMISRTAWKAMIVSQISLTGLKFLLFPVFDDRYYLSSVLIGLIALCVHVFKTPQLHKKELADNS